MLNDAKKHADGLMDSLKGFGTAALGFAGIGVGVSALKEGAKAAMEYAKHITILSEELGISTKMLQQFEYAARKTGASGEEADKALQKLAENVGKARMGEEASIKTLERWGISIYDANGHAKSMDEILDSVAQKMKEATDPTIQNAMAMELGGKSARNLVSALKDFDEFKEKSKNKILSESELATLDNAEKKLKNMGGTLKSWSTHAFAAILAPFFNNDADAMKKHLEGLDQSRASAQQPTEAQLKEAKEMAKALDELHKAQASGGATDPYMVAKLKEMEIEKELAQTKEGSLEHVKLETELAKVRHEIAKAEAADTKKANEDKAKHAKEARAEEKKHQRELQEQKERELQTQIRIENAQTGANQAHRNLQQGFEDRTKFTVQELAERGMANYYSGNGETYAERTAVDISRLEQRAKSARDYGNTDFANELQSRADYLRKDIGYALTSGEADPMQSLREASEKSEKHLSDIKTLATTKGIKIAEDEDK